MITTEKLNFGLLTPTTGSGGGGERVGRGLKAKYLLLCCCFCQSLCFDMQHVTVLKRLNFDLLTPPSNSTQG